MGEYSDADIVPHWLRDWQALLFDNGWMIPGYPPELGGRNCTPVQTLIYLETMASRRVPRSGHFPGYAIVTPSLLEFGNEEQRALAPAAARGDTIWCIGMSEPNAGSDLAGLQTRADVFDDHFVVNGQKVWTSYATIAQKCFCYVRTDPDAPKHKGISLLIIDMDTPGIDARPLTHINRKADFAEVFFTDVVVPRENLVGELHHGWAITQGSLAHERAGLWVESVGRFEQTVQGLVALARRTGRDSDPVIRRKIAAGLRARGELARARLQGFRILRTRLQRPGALIHEDGDGGGGQGRVRTRHGDLRPVRRGHRRRTGTRSGPVGQQLLRIVRQHDRGWILGNPAQHHRPTSARAPPPVRFERPFERR